MHASLGDVDEAFRWLDFAIEERSPGLLLLRVHPRLDPIRNDPRYLPLVRRLGLEGAGNTAGNTADYGPTAIADRRLTAD
jgi:hypothetical protein